MIRAADGKRDFLFCGTGKDRFEADPVDVVQEECEVRGAPVMIQPRR